MSWQRKQQERNRKNGNKPKQMPSKEQVRALLEQFQGGKDERRKAG